MKNIRNFTIIAHIDHGKSTLADRLIGLCNTKDKPRKDVDRVLDSMDLEKERGITIKSQSARLEYERDGETYILNLIDTPGHVDFSYEVLRSLYACEGSILLIDATKGVQAQTVKNACLSIEAEHELITAINKIDSPLADKDKTIAQLKALIGINHLAHVSAKTGEGVEELIHNIIDHIPSPTGNPDTLFRGFVVDSWYDKYFGVTALIRIVDGTLTANTEVYFLNSKCRTFVCDVGYFTPQARSIKEASVGDICYMVTREKDASNIDIGDTLCIFHEKESIKPIFDEFKTAMQSVFCGIIPTEKTTFDDLRIAIEKLHLNDSSFSFSRFNSNILGSGMRCGFLGLLHMDIITTRLTREFDLSIVSTTPAIVYKVITSDGQEHMIDDPSLWPSPTKIIQAFEPFCDVMVIAPVEYMGGVISLCKDRRAEHKDIKNIDVANIAISVAMPFAEIISGFQDDIQSITQGYGSFNYDEPYYREAKIVKICININFETANIFSVLAHTDSAYKIGKHICEKLCEILPRQQYKIPIQAVINDGKVIARADIKPYRKDVTAKCYGGDKTRKRKLLEKQKKGKDRMSSIGAINIPKDAAIKVFKTIRDAR